jgi:hypothetical protein
MWGLTFFAIAYTVKHASEPGMIAVVLIGICFVAVMISGIADTRAARRGESAGEHRGMDAGTNGRGRDPDECQDIE